MRNVNLKRMQTFSTNIADDELCDWIGDQKVEKKEEKVGNMLHMSFPRSITLFFNIILKILEIGNTL